MGSERLYYDDSYTTRFEARVVDRGGHAGQTAVELERTFFYPESGGQLADRGRLGETAVIDVQSEDDGRIWHVLSSDLPEDSLEAEVDWTRRFDSMQQHTGQHILSAAFERMAKAPTVSSHLGEDRSSIEVTLGDASWAIVGEVEEAANRIVWEDRPIERHWVTEADLARFELRKPPPRDRAGAGGRIRIVEIPDWDVSACGGTHTRRTGEVGAIKVVRWEKVRGNVRFEFLCGARALADHAWRTEALVERARRHTLKDSDLLDHLERAMAERDELRKRLADLTERLIETEAREKVGAPPRAVEDLAERRSREEIRKLAIQCLAAGAPWVCLAARAPDPVLVLGRAKSGSFDLKSLTPELLARCRGKGGGSPDLLQVAGESAEAIGETWRWAVETLRREIG